MTKFQPAVAIALFLACVAGESLANCRGEIEGPGQDQIGMIALFSSRGGGPEHKLFGSEFWALAGPYDTHRLYSYPVRFTPDLMETVDRWNWANAAVATLIRSVRVDAIHEQEQLWIIVKELLLTDE